jgi:hypothetical protein
MNHPQVIILESGTQAKGVRHVDGVFFRCCDCGKVKATSGNGCSVGYARFGESDSLVCYACADERQREELKDRSKSFGAYVSSDGKQITSWTGGLLMRVTQSWSCALSRRSNWHDAKSFKCIRAVDVHGGKWFGRGSAGVCITMRPCKG